MTEFNIQYIPEPELKFNKGSSFNPMVGLIKYGPRLSSKEEINPTWVKLGMIGSARSISQAKHLFENMRIPYTPDEVKKWALPFPGFLENSSLRISISFDPQWEQIIDTDEIEICLKESTKEERAEKFVHIIEEKLRILYETSSPPPDVVVISIPKEIEEKCSDIRFEKPLIKLTKGDDFHNRIKLIGMQYKLPTQLIRPDTLQFKGTQEKSIVFWNLSVGILYKSQKGYPWKLTKLEAGTCYVGISFYKERSSSKMRASMAQVFLDTGESFILRGDPFKWSNKKYPNSPHLSKDGAKNLLKKVLKQYNEVKGNTPSRIVIHKSSNFWDEEYEGFLEASEDIKYKDFVTIQLRGSDIRFYREAEYGVLRGTVISFNDNSENYLYTTGFVPCLDTYPGLGIPIPLKITCRRQDSEILKICKEILEFTKLDWNNCFIYRKEPVTISVSRKVAQVLAETKSMEMKNLDPHYYFYM